MSETRLYLKPADWVRYVERDDDFPPRSAYIAIPGYPKIIREETLGVPDAEIIVHEGHRYLVIHESWEAGVNHNIFVQLLGNAPEVVDYTKEKPQTSEGFEDVYNYFLAMDSA